GGRVLETIWRAERGVASCGGGLYPFAPGGPGSRPPGTTTWLRGARCTDPEIMPETEARPRGPKPPRWSAERRASRVMGRKAPRKRLARRVMAWPTRVSTSTRPFLSAPPPPSFGVSDAKSQTPGAENAPRERDGLFDIVRWVERDAVLILMSAHRRAAHFKKSQAAPRTRSTNLW